jgi:hypothetical protein
MEIENRLLGLLFVFLGVCMIYYVIKNPSKGRDPALSDVKIIFAILGFIGMGIAMMLGTVDFF